jgi:hypothetical protein
MVGKQETRMSADDFRIARHSAGNKNRAASLHTRVVCRMCVGHHPIRLAKQALDPHSMRVWPAGQKLPAPKEALR